jgi:RHS repeat-associated protein
LRIEFLEERNSPGSVGMFSAVAPSAGLPVDAPFATPDDAFAAPLTAEDPASDATAESTQPAFDDPLAPPENADSQTIDAAFIASQNIPSAPFDSLTDWDNSQLFDELPQGAGAVTGLNLNGAAADAAGFGSSVGGSDDAASPASVPPLANTEGTGGGSGFFPGAASATPTNSAAGDAGSAASPSVAADGSPSQGFFQPNLQNIHSDPVLRSASKPFDSSVGQQGGSFRSLLTGTSNGDSAGVSGGAVANYSQYAGSALLQNNGRTTPGGLPAQADPAGGAAQKLLGAALTTAHTASVASPGDVSAIILSGKAVARTPAAPQGEFSMEDPTTITSTFTVHESGDNANGSFTLDETVSITTTIEDAASNSDPTQTAVSYTGTVQYDFEPNGVDDSGTPLTPQTGTESVSGAGTGDSAGFDLDQYNSTRFFANTTWTNVVKDVSGNETTTVQQTGTTTTADGTTSYTLNDVSTATISGEEHDGANDAITEQDSGTDNLSLTETGTETADGVTVGFTLTDTTADTFTDNEQGSGPASSDIPVTDAAHAAGTDAITLQECGTSDDGHGNTSTFSVTDTTNDGFTDADNIHPADSSGGTDGYTDNTTGTDDFAVHASGTTVNGNATDNFQLDDQTHDNFADQDQGEDDGSGAPVTDTDHVNAAGTDNLSVQEVVTTLNAVKGLRSTVTVNDTTQDGFHDQDTTIDNPGTSNNSDQFGDSVSGADTYNVQGTQSLDDGHGNTSSLSIGDTGGDQFNDQDTGAATNLQDTQGSDQFNDSASGNDILTVQGTGATDDGLGDTSTFSLQDTSHNNFTEGDSGGDALDGSADHVMVNDSDSGDDAFTVHETGAVVDAADGINLNYSLDDASGDTYHDGLTDQQTDAGATTTGAATDTGNATGTDIFNVQDSGSWRDAAHGILANFNANVGARDTFTDSGSDDLNLGNEFDTENANDSASGSANVTGVETGSLTTPTTSASFTANDTSKDNFLTSDGVNGSIASEAADGSTLATPVVNDTDQFGDRTTGNDNLTILESGTWADDGSTISYQLTDGGADGFLAADGGQVQDHAGVETGADTTSDNVKGVDGYLVTEQLPTLQVGGLTAQVSLNDLGNDQFGFHDSGSDAEAADGTETSQDSGGDTAGGGDNYSLTASGVNVFAGSPAGIALGNNAQSTVNFAITDSGTGTFHFTDSGSDSAAGVVTDSGNDDENTRENFNEHDSGVVAGGGGSISFTNDLHEKKTVKGDDSFSDGATDDDSLTTTTDDSGSEALSLSNGLARNTSFTNHDQEVTLDGATVSFIRQLDIHSDTTQTFVVEAGGNSINLGGSGGGNSTISAFQTTTLTTHNDESSDEEGMPSDFTFTLDRTERTDAPTQGYTQQTTDHGDGSATLTVHAVGSEVNGVDAFTSYHRHLDAETTYELLSVGANPATDETTTTSVVQDALGAGVAAAATEDDSSTDTLISTDTDTGASTTTSSSSDNPQGPSTIGLTLALATQQVFADALSAPMAYGPPITLPAASQPAPQTDGQYGALQSAMQTAGNQEEQDLETPPSSGSSPSNSGGGASTSGPWVAPADAAASSSDEQVVNIGPGSVLNVVTNAKGEVVSRTDPDGNNWTYAYDAAGRETMRTNPQGQSVETTYNSAGLPASITDENGRTELRSYDDNGNLTQEIWQDAQGITVETLSYTYDASNHMLSATDSAGSVSSTYNAAGQLASQTDVFGLTLSYSYDTAGNVTQVTDSQGGVTTSTYNAENQLTSRSLSGTATPARVDLTYTDQGQLQSVIRSSDAAGTQLAGSTAYSYDASGDVTDIENQNAAGETLSSYQYQYNTPGQVSSETWSSNDASGPLSGSRTFSYDASGQLTSDGSTQYSYNANGNPTNPGDVIGQGNQILSDGTWLYSYDAAGNLIEKMQGPGQETWYYSYDFHNRLVEARQTSDGTTDMLRVDYSYDALGRRVQEAQWEADTGETTVTRFAYGADSRVVAELDANNVVQARYLNGDGATQVFARTSGSNGVLWLLTDQLGSVRDVADAVQVQDHVEYTAFGAIASESAPAAAVNVLFAGMRYSRATGLYTTPHRDYDPEVTQWIQVDPSGFQAGDSNLYRYVANDPTNAIDPSGLKTKLVLREATGGNFHVTIVWFNDTEWVRFDGGGHGESHPTDTTRPRYHRTPSEKTDPIPAGGLKGDYAGGWHVTTSDHKTDDAELKALDLAFSKIRQVPYNLLTANSNTYARRVLEEAGFDVIRSYEEVMEPTSVDIPWPPRPNPQNPSKDIYSPKRPDKYVLFYMYRVFSSEVGPTSTQAWNSKVYGGDTYDKYGNEMKK